MVSSCSTFIPLFPSLIPVLSKTLDTTLTSEERVGTLSYESLEESVLHWLQVCRIQPSWCWGMPLLVLCVVSWKDVKLCQYLSSSFEVSLWFLPLNFIYALHYSCWFVWTEPPLHCCYEVSMVMVYDLINALKFVLQAFYWQVFFLSGILVCSFILCSDSGLAKNK